MKRIYVVVLMLIVLLFVGCSGDSTKVSVLEDGEMSFAMTGQYPPFNFINEDGDLAGFDIDIANALAKEMGVTAAPVTTEWGGILAGLVGKRFDTIIGSMAITADRLEEVNFSNPYYYDGAQFFALNDSELNSIDDLVDGKVGAVTGTTFYDALSEMDNVEEILQFSSDVDNFMALEQGRSDGLVTGLFVGLQAPEKYEVDIKPVGPLLYSEEIGIAVRKEDEDLLIELNKALDEIIINGTYEELSNKWFGINLLDK